MRAMHVKAALGAHTKYIARPTLKAKGGLPMMVVETGGGGKDGAETSTPFNLYVIPHPTPTHALMRTQSIINHFHSL